MALFIRQLIKGPGNIARNQSRGLVGLDGDAVLDVECQGLAVRGPPAALNGIDMQVVRDGEQPTPHIGAGLEQR